MQEGMAEENAGGEVSRITPSQDSITIRKSIMTTATAISETEYLASSYEPDCDYADGRLQERNVGEYDHSRLQTLLAVLLSNLEKRHGGRLLTGQRCRVASGRYRIPDVCAMRAAAPRERVLTEPPQIVIEILSPEDHLQAQLVRLTDYRAWAYPISGSPIRRT
jgi:Uma2 family endonuclease